MNCCAQPTKAVLRRPVEPGRRAGGRCATRRPLGPAAAILAAVPAPAAGRTVPVEHNQSGLVRQPVFRAGGGLRRARRRASALAGDTPMRAADSLRFIVPSGVSSRWPSPCRRACRASANPAYQAPHAAQPPAPSSHVQASCLERGRPAAVGAFAGVLAASSAAPPDRRRPERQRRAKAEGKIKGRGTSAREKPVCTWGWRGTRLGAIACRESAQCRIGIGEGACFARWTAPVLDGAVR